MDDQQATKTVFDAAVNVVFDKVEVLDNDQFTKLFLGVMILFRRLREEAIRRGLWTEISGRLWDEISK